MGSHLVATWSIGGTGRETIGERAGKSAANIVRNTVGKTRSGMVGDTIGNADWRQRLTSGKNNRVLFVCMLAFIPLECNIQLVVLPNFNAKIK